MKRLFSILLMNAWNSLSRKASLPTVGMVSVSVMALLVASTVTAGASPDTALSGAVKVASAVPKALVQLSLPILGDSGTPHHSTKPAPQKPAKDNNASATAGNNANAGVGNNGSSSVAPSGQVGTQSVAATLDISPTTTCQQGVTTYTVNAAELDLQTPAAAAGTVTWYWETRDDGTTGQQPTDSAISSQAFSAGVTKLTLSNPASSTDGSSQPLYTISTDATTARSFRLRVTGPVDITSNWFSVPVSAASCSSTTSTTTNS